MNDAESRDTYVMPIPILPYEPRSVRGEVLAPRGSIVIYLAASGSKSLRAIRAQARASEGSVGGYRSTESQVEDGHLVSLTFHRKVLADNVQVPRNGEVVRLILPFLGGEIDPSELLMHARHAGGSVEAVAIRHDPPISAVERAALSLLPRDMLSSQLGVALPGGIALNNDEERRRQAEEQRRAADDARAELAQQRAEAQAERAEARAEGRQGGGARIDIHMLDSTVKSISALQTVTAMLEIRRQLLLNQLGQRG